MEKLIQLIQSDNYTANHSQSVACFAKRIGCVMGLTANLLSDLFFAGLFHDIGKMVLPKNILYKPAALNSSERAQISLHPTIGATLAKMDDLPNSIIAMIGKHHERLDGSGYPFGLMAREIDPLTRIISVADVYTAMIAKRPYRQALPAHVALEELSKKNLYDQDVVSALKEVCATQKRKAV